MLFSLVGTIFRALKGWVARVCPDVLGGYCPGKMGGKRPFAAGTIKVCYADKPDFGFYHKMGRRDPFKLAKPRARVAEQRPNWPFAHSATISTADELFANNR